jgi:hypothetical protein
MFSASVPAYATQKHGESKTKTFTVTKGGTLEVRVDGGDIRISTWEKNEVSVRADIFDDEDDGDLRMTQSGNTVRVTNRGGWMGDARYEISVPSQFNLDLETAAGNLYVRGKMTGTLSGETSGGNISLDDVEGKVDMHTSGGDVKTGNVLGDAVLNTSGGDIEVTSTSGELNVRTSGGDIRLGNIGRSLTASTSGGDVVIGDVGGEARVSSSGGTIRVGKVNGRVSLSTAGGDIELLGGSGTIKASTSGGDMRLHDLSGSVEARTAGGDIHGELIPSGKGRSRLTTASGDIVLYVPESAKATIDARIRIQGRWRSERDEYKITSDFKAQSSEQDDNEREIRTKFVLNGGGEEITLETVNSNITIKKLTK